MATGTMEKVTNNSDSGYCKMPDGTLMQWGTAGEYRGQSSNDFDVTMPQEFASTNYKVFITGSWYSDPTIYEAFCTAIAKTTNVFSVHVKNPTGTHTYAVYWFAIGRWK